MYNSASQGSWSSRGPGQPRGSFHDSSDQCFTTSSARTTNCKSSVEEGHCKSLLSLIGRNETNAHGRKAQMRVELANR